MTNKETKEEMKNRKIAEEMKAKKRCENCRKVGAVTDFRYGGYITTLCKKCADLPVGKLKINHAK